MPKSSGATAPVRGDQGSRSFPASLGSAREARQFAEDCLRSRVPGPVIVDAVLLTGELAANALVHARSAFSVDITLSPRGVRICVRDATAIPAGSQVFPARPGHGLGIVARAAIRWGVEPLPGGKAVWVELRSG